jgi:hypothetical protein
VVRAAPGLVGGGLVAKVSGPLCAPLLDDLQLVRGDVVPVDIGQSDPVDVGELLGEHLNLETGIAFRDSRDQLVIAEPAGGPDRIDIEVVTRFASAIERGDLVADRI